MQHHILILMAVIGDPEWPDGLTFPHEAAYTKESSPLWLSTALTSNENYAHRHGHGIDIEFRKGPDFFDFQNKWCDRLPKQSKDRWNCYNSAHRENCTWYKFRQLLNALLMGLADFVLFVDCDAFILHKVGQDVLVKMESEMNSRGVNIMVADEDWRGAVGATNTGIVMVRNCEWSKYFFQEMLNMQENRSCGSNEQACFRGAYGRNLYNAQEHIHIASGLVWNRHPTRPLADWATNDTANIVHFMGGAKNGLVGVDVFETGLCPRALCLDVHHCARVARDRGVHVQVDQNLSGWSCTVGYPYDVAFRWGAHFYVGRAFVLPRVLHDPPGHRLTDFVAMRAVIAAAHRVDADVVMLVPPPPLTDHPLTKSEQDVLESHGIKVLIAKAPPLKRDGRTSTLESRVGSAIRNATLATGSRTRSISRPCVNAMILALHVLTLLQYDTVALLQHNVRPVSPDIEPLFTCGQLKEMLLTTSGGIAVVRPSEQAARAASIALDVLAKLPPGELPRTRAGVPWTLNFSTAVYHHAAVMECHCYSTCVTDFAKSVFRLQKIKTETPALKGSHHCVCVGTDDGGTQSNTSLAVPLGECARAALKVVWDSIRADDIAAAPSEESSRLTNAGQLSGQQEIYLDSCKWDHQSRNRRASAACKRVHRGCYEQHIANGPALLCEEGAVTGKSP